MDALTEPRHPHLGRGRARHHGAAPRRLSRAAASVAVALAVGMPGAALAMESAPTEGSEGGRRPVAETPRDQLGLVLLGALGAATVYGVANARRQLKGERPKADGTFRWR